MRQINITINQHVVACPRPSVPVSNPPTDMALRSRPFFDALASRVLGTHAHAHHRPRWPTR
ncbi:hypothetical protein ARSEF4850_003798 [Beauveria asiatica]